MAERPDLDRRGEPTVDLDSLHREEVYTDLKAASIRKLTPIRPDGSVDPARPMMFIGETTLATQLGPIPVQFALEADNLKDAFELFPEGVKEAVERLNERAKEMAREEASRIVVPGAMPPGAGGGMPGVGGRSGKLILDK